MSLHTCDGTPEGDAACFVCGPSYRSRMKVEALEKRLASLLAEHHEATAKLAQYEPVRNYYGPAGLIAVSDLIRERDDLKMKLEEAAEEERKFWAAKFRNWQRCQENGPSHARFKALGFEDCAIVLEENDRWIPDDRWSKGESLARCSKCGALVEPWGKCSICGTVQR